MKQYVVEITDEALQIWSNYIIILRLCCLLQRMQWGSITELLMRY